MARKKAKRGGEEKAKVYLDFLARADKELGKYWPLPDKPKPFEPLVFLADDRGDLVSLYEVLTKASKDWTLHAGGTFTEIDIAKVPDLARKLPRKIVRALESLDTRSYWGLLRAELARRAIRDAIPKSDVAESITDRARAWILNNEPPVPGLEMNLEFTVPAVHPIPGSQEVIEEVSLQAIRDSLDRYVKLVE